MTQSALFCIVYRTGGTDNFKWHRSLPMTSDEARNALVAEKRAGRRAMRVRYDDSMSIGLPETFDAGQHWQITHGQSFDDE